MTTGFGGALYVGDLGPEVTEANLFEIFNTVGPVASVRVCRDAATRRSLGYAYVNFHRVEDAEKALDVMNFKPIGGRACRVMWSQRDPSLRKSGVGNVFVKNLAPSIDNKTLFDTFSMFGNILSCKVVTDYTGKSLRYGFVHYETQEAADNAISRVDQKTIANEQVSVQPFKSKKERGAIDKQRYTNLYIRGFPFDTTAEELLELLGKHGKVTSHTVREYERKQPNSEESEKLKYAFANYSTTEEAQAALGALDGTEWKGNKLYVARAQLRHEREKMLRERRERKIAENQQRYAGINVYVKNLPDTVDKNRLNQEFSKFGTITSAVVMLDATTNKSRGFGFVCFTTPEEATQAISQMNGAILDGKPLYVALHQRKEVRKALLEAQFARQKYPPMYPGYMYGYPSRNFPAYPPQFMRRGWPAGQAMAPNYFPGQMPVPNAQQRSYQLMPAGPRPMPGAAGEPSPQRQRVPGGRQPAPGARGQQPRQPQQRRAQATGPQAGRLLAHLQTLNPTQQKQFLGEKLFPLIQQIEPQQAGKITGMLLEMDAGEIIHLIEDDNARSLKVGEAMAVLQSAGVDE